VIVTDIKMPAVDGVEVLRHAHQISPDSAVILMTAVDDYEAAVQAVKAGGATDYIRKSPGLVDDVKLAIARALTGFRSAARTSPSAATRPRATRSTTSSASVPRSKHSSRPSAPSPPPAAPSWSMARAEPAKSL